MMSNETFRVRKIARYVIDRENGARVGGPYDTEEDAIKHAQVLLDASPGSSVTLEFLQATPMKTLEQELAELINRRSAENDSNTPDYILAKFLAASLAAFNEGVNGRETYYGTSKVQAAIDDPSPGIPHDEVMDEMDKIIVDADLRRQVKLDSMRCGCGDGPLDEIPPTVFQGDIVAGPGGTVNVYLGTV